MKIQMSDSWRILLAGAIIAATSSLVTSQISQWRFDSQVSYMERQHDKRISAIKAQHTKEVNALKKAAGNLENIEKKIDKLMETKGK